MLNGSLQLLTRSREETPLFSILGDINQFNWVSMKTTFSFQIRRQPGSNFNALPVDSQATRAFDFAYEAPITILCSNSHATEPLRTPLDALEQNLSQQRKHGLQVTERQRERAGES